VSPARATERSCASPSASGGTMIDGASTSRAASTATAPASIAAAAKRDARLALEIALCGRLIKGYGDTHKRGKGNFLRILDTLVEGDAVPDDRARIEAIRKAREAALADPEGRKLEQSLETHGIAPLPPKPKPVKFMRRTQPENRTAA